MERSPGWTGRQRRNRIGPVIGAVAVFAVAIGAGTSQAGVGDSPRGSGRSLGDILDGLGQRPGGGGAQHPPHAECPHQAEELGLCKPDPDHADPQDDYEAFPGGRRSDGHRHRGRHRHDHDHLSAAASSASGQTAGKTSVEQTIAGTGDPADGFQTLELGPGEPWIVREDLAEAKQGRAKRRISLLYAGQTTDWQLADEESPARVEMVDITANPPFPDPLSAAWRPQEAFGPFAVEQSIRQLNRFVAESPVPQRKGKRAVMEMALVTGDNADNQQYNETAWAATLLEGGPLDPNSGISPSGCPVLHQPVGQTADPELYAGVQDYDDYVEGNQFYDPDDPVGIWSDWPTYPGLMDRAQIPFQAEGLDVPSYVVFGNHDGLAQGNEKALAPFELVGVGCLKPMVPVSNFAEALETLDPAYLLGILNTNPAQLMFVPPDPDRRYVDKRQYKELFASGAQPDDHGFGFVDDAELQASDGSASYYAWTPKPGIRMIGLDTLCEGGIAGIASSGNVDDPQFRWLEDELEAAQDSDQLIVVFGHHPMGSLGCTIPDETPLPAALGSDCTVNDSHGHDINPGCDQDPRPSTPIHDGEDLTALFHRFPNVITYIAGHTHENSLSEFNRPSGGAGDFWGIETASLVDWPPQNRLIELMDNCDGTLSIFGTILDSQAPATAPASGTEAATLNGADLASISRTLAFNDPQAGFGSGEGEPSDRNVELLLEDPRDDPSERCERKRGKGDPDGDDGGDQDGGGGTGDTDGSLPFTGLILLGLVVVGASLLGGGGLLRLRRRSG